MSLAPGSGLKFLMMTAVLMAGLVIPATAAPLNETWSATFGGPMMENGYAAIPAAMAVILLQGMPGQRQALSRAMPC